MNGHHCPSHDQPKFLLFGQCFTTSSIVFLAGVLLRLRPTLLVRYHLCAIVRYHHSTYALSSISTAIYSHQ